MRRLWKRGVKTITAPLLEAQPNVETIVVADPHGHLARWLDQQPVDDAKLSVKVQGSPDEIRVLRHRINTIAETGRDPAQRVWE